ncbi:MAG: ATP-binding protein [Sphingobacteriales bacterium JAD_PAG50586_3]|nr:MAG: ATP-binding protein [Sphingobacteriales bacterium JAD_PAG50586_3]
MESRDVIYMVTFSCLKAEDNGPCYGMAVTQNITELIRTERLLDEQKQLYGDVLEAVSAGVWHWPDIKKPVQWWSKRYYELLGYAEDEIEASLINFSKLIHPDDVKPAFAIHTQHSPKYPVFYIEYRLKSKSGVYKWYLASGKIKFNNQGEPTSMLGSLIDINDRKVAEDALINATLKFRGIFNNASSYMALLSPDGKYVECSPSLLNLRRKSLYEVLDTYIWDLGTSPVDKTGGETLKRFIDDANKGKQSKESILFTGETMGTKYLTVTAKPIYDTDRKVAFIIMEAYDITDITEAKNTLASQKEQLENFAYITSHNLRAPAANINMLVDLLKHDIEPESKDQYLQKITQSATVLIDTIDTLAEILKIRNNVEVTKDTIDFAKMLSQVEGEMDAIINTGNATIVSNFDKCPSVKFPKAYMKSVFINMITNSIKYASTDRAPHITITSYMENDGPVLQFSDNGIGIDLNRHSGKIFGLYKVFTRRKDAHGVGLFLVKNQVESQGGNISVTSTLGQGTTFTIHF